MGACGGEGPYEEVVAEGQEELVTAIIPTSRTCVSALVPGGCVNVPARQCQPDKCSDDPDFSDERGDPLARILTPREILDKLGTIFKLPPITRLPPITQLPPITRFPPGLLNPIIPPYIDGKRAKGEYDGATQLPYTDVKLRAGGGTVYLRVNRYNHSDSEYRGTLRVFLENIPAPSPYLNFDWAQEGGRFAIFIDHDRFRGTTTTAGSEDRYYTFDLRGEKKPTVYRGSANGPAQSLGGFAFHMGQCEPDPSTYAIMRCDAELEIPLPHSAFANFPTPDDDLVPGIGFSFYRFPASDPAGAIPEDLTKKGFDEANRAYSISLLLGAPRGFPVRYMTWNIRRSVISELAGPFKATPNRDIGDYLADKADVIAIQEGWNESMVNEVVFAANQKRAAMNLEPLHSYGPVDFNSSIWRDLILEIVGKGGEGTYGGLWVFSKLPAAQQGFHSFDACKGEDCFKAKGVQHVRLRLNPPTPANHPDCTNERLMSGAPEVCKTPPSGDHYIDVFNIHTQASNTKLCGDLDALAGLDKRLDAIPSLLHLGYEAVKKLDQLYGLRDQNWNCGRSDESIRRAQLYEANRYIEQVTSEDRDRPVIIMGDLNIDGRDLGPEYQGMLAALRIGPSNREEYPVSDIINPARWDQDWDIDHGDLARERFENWENAKCMGTFIGDEEGTAFDGDCAHAAHVDGKDRFDYILVRPPYAPDDPNYQSAKWVARKLDDWYSPYPGFSNDYKAGPPIRLSDHKPVLAAIEHAEIWKPARIHSNWKHTVELRVKSADATTSKDCALWCGGAVDMYTYGYGAAIIPPWDFEWRQWKQKSSECSDRMIVEWPVDHCMHDWRHDDKHDPGVEAGNAYGGRLYDADLGFWNSDEPIHVGAFKWPIAFIAWDDPRPIMGLRGWESELIPGLDDVEVTDVAPIPLCTPGGAPSMCLKIATEELPPGQQF